LFPAPHLFDDGVGVGGPGEGFGFFVGLGEVAMDGRLEINDALEDAPLEPLSGQRGEEPFDGVEPGGRGRDEVKVEPRMPDGQLSSTSSAVNSVVMP
jgi:hypothetical protein